MNVLAIDVGGTNVKILATGQTEPRKFPSGPTMTPKQMVAGVKKLAGDWKYQAVSIGYPGMVVRNRPLVEPHNLGRGWVGFNFQAAFKRPVKVVNGTIEPMELAHLPYKNGTYEDYVGERSLEKRGKKKWRRHVADVVERLIAALEPDDVVLGGGNVKKLKELPKGCRKGDNTNGFLGGFRLWDSAGNQRRAPGARSRKAKKRSNRRLKVVAAPKSPAMAKAS